MKFASNSKSWKLLKRTPITSAVSTVQEAFDPALFDKYNIRLGIIDFIPTISSSGRLYFMGSGSSAVLVKQYNVHNAFYMCSLQNLIINTPSSLIMDFKKIGQYVFAHTYNQNTSNNISGGTLKLQHNNPQMKDTTGTNTGNVNYMARLIDHENIETINFSIGGPDFSGGNFEIWGQLK